MKRTKKLYGFILALLIIFLSIFIVVAPTFFSKDIARASVDEVIDFDLLLEGESKIELVFFGYSGCAKICTPRLQDLSKYYNSLNSQMRDKLSVVFLDISQPEDKNLPKDFAAHFHEDFKGIYLSNDNLRVYTKAFQVYFAQSLFDPQEFNHSSNLYLITKNKGIKKLRYIYNAYPFDFKQITLDIKDLMNESI